ncbi:hypothetical protein GII33_10805 [Gordonia pseudamarae]|jgi:hypothetical protein|uniref:Uncharacterized protein n=1 Tax=Gordonia pseudamarae TaxID=2831662 RepID=A0ABX6IIU4_9ACTN|nr:MULTISPECIES: hypothetical protein [Gordonia]MBD0022428.1 hypothetical protein [Gordonia sp. (in: high G+C Gram-positive bacteria)]QHN26383.1 hypothetical protein GII33_10805 [Gordonia pseudamarae]QHN35279.1 hypothetical protein GII31_10625 [Gordonia pseudamarae]
MWWVLISIAAILVIAGLAHNSGSLDYGQREIDATIDQRHRQDEQRARRARREAAAEKRPQPSATRVRPRHLPLMGPATIYR